MSTNAVLHALKARLGAGRLARLRTVKRRALGLMFRNDLIALAKLHGTDKWNTHWYAQHYARHFLPLRTQRVNLLEIGVGGYNDPRAGGMSLRMWKDYFKRGHIHGLDVYDKSPLEEARIRIFRGSQNDPDCLRRVAREIGRLDIVIDDGSHINEHVITSFDTLFPLLAEGGIYVIEDTQTSYWPEYGGSSTRFDGPHTMLGRAKSLVESVNHEEIIRPGVPPSYFDQHVVRLEFCHNMAFVYKGRNNEGSTVLKGNAWPADRATRSYDDVQKPKDAACTAAR
ncbi:MAG: class I SAM-dependent methyltransferase [Betaproteobacteria bacterium]|nr:class I SAM-dependent methyltransferase [Betaproteobacteria bacterium]